MFSAGQCLHREPSPSLRAALSHRSPSPWPPQPQTRTHRLRYRDKLIHTFLITFIHNPIQSNFTTWTVDKVIDTHSTLVLNTSVSGSFLSNYQTQFCYNYRVFQQSLVKVSNTNSYLYEHIFNPDFSYSTHWCQTGREWRDACAGPSPGYHWPILTELSRGDSDNSGHTSSLTTGWW